MMPTALLLDVGRVVIDLTFDAVRAYESATGEALPHAAELLAVGDPDVAARRGELEALVALCHTLAEVVPETLFVPDAVALIDAASRAGRPVGLLTNHAHTMLGEAWLLGRPELAGLSASIDAAELGFPKPDPKAYLTAADRLGVAPGDVVFLDDTLDCVMGARTVGMVGIVVDPLDRWPAFTRARVMLGLGW